MAGCGFYCLYGRPPSVILSAAKDLSLGRAQILRCAQDDSSAEVHVSGAYPALEVRCQPPFPTSSTETPLRQPQAVTSRKLPVWVICPAHPVVMPLLGVPPAGIASHILSNHDLDVIENGARRVAGDEDGLAVRRRSNIQPLSSRNFARFRLRRRDRWYKEYLPRANEVRIIADHLLVGIIDFLPLVGIAIGSLCYAVRHPARLQRGD